MARRGTENRGYPPCIENEEKRTIRQRREFVSCRT